MNKILAASLLFLLTSPIAVAQLIPVIVGFVAGGAIVGGLEYFLVLINRLKLRVEKEMIIECSELVNEENFKRMLKNAEIKQFADDYNKLLRAYVKEKITQPRKVIAQLLGVIKEVKEEGKHEQDKVKGS